MNIDKLTYKELKEVLNLFADKDDQQSPVLIGDAYLFRTVTHIELGRVKSICGKFVTLEDASWIADTGRYHDCFVSGDFSEVEPYPDTTTVNIDSLINFAPWPHSLPRTQK